MPKQKPNSLNRRKDSKDDHAARAAAESMLTPQMQLSADPPQELQNRKIARTAWRRIISLQNETQAAKDGSPIITAFDERTLIVYCKMIEEEKTLEEKLNGLDKAQAVLSQRAEKFKPTAENFKDWVTMLAQLNGLTSNFKGMSARLDAHRASMHELAKSMYLTPAARAGVAIPMKEPDQPKSEMDKLLDGEY
jgi:phage terminase small subunit